MITRFNKPVAFFDDDGNCLGYGSVPPVIGSGAVFAVALEVTGLAGQRAGRVIILSLDTEESRVFDINADDAWFSDDDEPK